MTMTFMSSPSLYMTSESVTEGHPDKLCDQIADAILDEILAHDPTAHVACEVTTTTGLVVILGEISTRHHVDHSGIARQVIRDVGHTKPEYGFDGDSCGIIVSIKEQSPEIAAAVGTDEGAGDQGIMMGFACTETPDLMPLPINLAHHLCIRLAECRKQGILPYLRPDGKSQVTVEYSFGAPKRVQAVVIAAQHDPDVGSKQLWDDVAEQVIRPIVGPWMDDNTDIHVNRSGSFLLGGPPPAPGPPRGGAKNLVAPGLADRIEVELSYAIGHPQPLGVSIETFGTHKFDHGGMLELVKEHFNLSPHAIIRDLDLRRPIYRATASYGHFGRHDIDAPWERTDKAEAPRRAAGR